MPFDYDVMPKRNKENSKGEIMRECNNCGNRTYMLYEEDENYRVVCEYCEEEHAFKANSMDKAMQIWKEMELQADCEYCPLGWEERGYEGECYDCGCMADEDISWCHKTFQERQEKSKDLLDERLEKYEVIDTSSHSEKHIVEGCIALMEEVHEKMLEYMELMGFKYDSENPEEDPRIPYTYFEIVQKLLLYRTTHSGGTSTREKCKQLGFESNETVVIGEICNADCDT